MLVLAMAVGVIAIGATPPAAEAGAGSDCSFTADPPNSQYRGWDITVTGSFTGVTNQSFSVWLATGFGLLGPQGTMLQPSGMVDGSGSFDHTVTIPSDHPTGDFDLVVFASIGLVTFKVCSVPYSVNSLFIGPIVTIPTTTTLGIVLPTSPTSPTTIPPITTTTPTTTTTVAPTTSVSDTTTTTILATTTTVGTTSTTGDAGEALVTGDGDGGTPVWMIVLLILMALALAGIGGYALARRRARSA